MSFAARPTTVTELVWALLETEEPDPTTFITNGNSAIDFNGSRIRPQEMGGGGKGLLNGDRKRQ